MARPKLAALEARPVTRLGLPVFGFGVFVRALMFALLVGGTAPAFADRVDVERANAALVRLQLRPDQREPFGKILEDYYSRRKMLYRREIQRSPGEDIERHLAKPLENLGEKTLKKLVEVLDPEQMKEARTLIEASTSAFMSEVAR